MSAVMTEAELLTNLPAAGVRVFTHPDSPTEFRCANDTHTWIDSEEGWLAASYFSPERFLRSGWTDITPTPAPSLRDQRIAEAWERWPDGRLFEDTWKPNPETPNLRMIVDGRMWSVLKHKGAEWFDEDVANLPVFVNSDRWAEIPNPNTPTLPDPSGDLPDGTRVRIVFEGATRGWDGEGIVLVGSTTASQYWLNLAEATVEVLSLPTPPPSALDGEPGSLWRDPETGGTYYRTEVTEPCGSNPLLVLVADFGEGNLLTRLAPWTDEHREALARLVPAQVADDE